MPTIEFRAKIQSVYTPENEHAYDLVKVPAIKRSHCDMAAFRASRRFGSYANSDMFPGMLRRALNGLGIRSHIRLDQLPEGVSVDTSGFLAKVRIELATTE